MKRTLAILCLLCACAHAEKKPPHESVGGASDDNAAGSAGRGTGGAPLDGASGATTGGGADNDSPCDAPNAHPLWGKRYDAELDCVDTESHTENVGCVLTPDESSAARVTDGFSCLMRFEDGAEFWVFSFYELGFDQRIWERCGQDRPRGRAPKPCYAAACPSGPRSTCPLEETKRWITCGEGAEFDENCCGRPECKDDADCAEDQVCLQVESQGLECWDNPGNPCDCTGPFMFAGKRCVAAP